MNILLIPGFMLDSDLWADLRSDLEGLGRTVDADTTQDTSIEAIADRTVASLSAPAIVIGFSMGGYVARAIAYRAPEMVAGLSLIATSSRGDETRLAASRRKAANSTRAFRRLSKSAVSKSLAPEHRTDVMIERVQLMSERLGGEVFGRQSQLIREGDTDRLGEIRCPTLVVAAAEDELRTVAESEVMRDGIAGAEMKIIGESGHLIPLEQPRALVSVLEPFIAIASQTR